MVKKRALIASIIGGIAICGFLLFAEQQQKEQQKTTQKAVNQNNSQVTAANKPDLLVEKVEFSTAPAGNDATQVTILYTLYNDSSVWSRARPTAVGKQHWQTNPSLNWLFEVSLEVRDYPNGTFQWYGGGATELSDHARQVWNRTETVPAGKKREYRIRVDPDNWIDEIFENNNEKTAIWPVTPIEKPTIR